MRYLPFIVISLVLYILFFYHNQQPELLSANQTNLDEKIIPLDFDEVAQLDKKSLDKANAVTETEFQPQQPKIDEKTMASTIVIATSSAEKTVAPALITTVKETSPKEIVSTKTTTAIKSSHKNNALIASIKSTSADEVSRLRGELYDENFHLDLPAPPVKKKVPKKKKAKTKQTSLVAKTTTPKNEVVTDSISSELLKQKSNVISKPKKTVMATPVEPQAEKKNEKPKRAFKKHVKPMQAANDEKNLQEAIAVSGNKPRYPEKAKAEKQQGQVAVKFTVNMQGKSKNPEIVRSSGHKILDNAVLEFIATERFMPALKGIEKVTSEQQFYFKYELK